MSESYLADNLRSLREAKKYSQKYISEQLHIARQTYTVYESCNRVPDLSVSLLISMTFLWISWC